MTMTLKYPSSAARTSWHRRTAAALALLASAGLLAACSQDPSNAQNAVAVGGTFDFVSPGGQTEIRYEQSERAPLREITGDSLMEPDRTVSLNDFAGQIVVLNSWGQWCGPCRSESDDLQRVHEYLEQHEAGTVFGINVRDYSREIAQDFVLDNGLSYPSIYDPPFKSAAALGGVPTSVVPTTIVLDQQHRPAAVFLREITDSDLIEVIDQLRAETSDTQES